MQKTKALVLLSGGLDSILAAKLLLNQGIAIEAINFVTPFSSGKEGESCAEKAAKQLSVPLKVVSVGKDYLRMLRNPKHGYGKNMNPCIDCKIFFLRKAKKYAKEIGASFLVTGEVLGERPMSQHFGALKLIEEEAGLRGKILRPLSAKLLPATEAEKRGLVDRKKLLAIQGRSRKQQIQLAKEFGINKYPSPAGGCLLTCKEYADKLRDLLQYKRRFSMKDIFLLKVGRHFRLGRNKIIVGRNAEENKILMAQRARSDYYFEVADVGSPITILQGVKTKKAIQTAAALTAFYSDAKSSEVTIKFGRDRLDKAITVRVPTRDEVESLRIGKA
ncbi:MAG: 7-cyano-7-deazaguanine synthase [Candidatus Bathyarchaeales archaeon]